MNIQLFEGRTKSSDATSLIVALTVLAPLEFFVFYCLFVVNKNI